MQRSTINIIEKTKDQVMERALASEHSVSALRELRHDNENKLFS